MIAKHLIYTGLILVILTVFIISGLAYQTQRDIAQFHHQVRQVAQATPSLATTLSPAQLAALPAPVQRYIAFTFRGPIPAFNRVELSMSGQFRRPQTRHFMPTTTNQTIAINTPALVFDARTPIKWGT